MKPPKYWGLLVLAAIFGVIASSLLMFAAVCRYEPTENKGVKVDFDELEFVVIHRPHLTYFVDLKYLLCFATRKPDYQDLVQFHCPERVWQEIREGLQVKAKTKDGGVK